MGVVFFSSLVRSFFFFFSPFAPVWFAPFFLSLNISCPFGSLVSSHPQLPPPPRLALLHGHLKRNMGRLEMEEGVDEGMFRSVSAAVAAVDATDQVYVLRKR